MLVRPFKNTRILLAIPPRAARIDSSPSYFNLKSTARIPASGEETMSSNERRIDTRVNIRVPLRFRSLNAPSSPEQIAESENISQRGIYFETDALLKVGMPLEVSLRMPQELAGKSSSDVKCVARVVHVRPNLQAGGRSGIGLHIERYEARVSSGERWTS
jgi:PilZ domain